MAQRVSGEFPQPISIPVGSFGDEQISLSTHIAGEASNDRESVVFCHGFPDLGFGWRNQLPAVANAGFRAIAPDLRGYGASSAPSSPTAYGLTELTDDLVGLLDALEISKAVFVGHDWGGFLVWAMAVLHPERVSAVAAITTPYIAFPNVATHLGIVGGDVERQYVAWFQEVGVAEAEMDANVETILERIFRSGTPLLEQAEFALSTGELNFNPFHNPGDWPILGDPVGTAADLQRYCDVYSRAGFTGGINWYRNADRNAAEHPEIGIRHLDIAALMITAENDPGLRPEFADGMENRISDLERHDLPQVGHWAHAEQPDVVNELLLNWLDGLS